MTPSLSPASPTPAVRALEGAPVRGFEPVADYARRAAANTLLWLEDRSANCHPIFYSRKDSFDLLAEYLQGGNSLRLRKLRKGERDTVLTLLTGYAFAIRSREVQS